MFEVKTRSEDSWGPLAFLEVTTFHSMINERRWPVTYRIDQYINGRNNSEDCE